MAELYHPADPVQPQYFCWDRAYYEKVEDSLATLKTSRTVYVGNLSFFTTELQIHEAFSAVGPINRIIMGLNLITKEPCGFAFVEYFTREAAEAALNFVSGTLCDARAIRCDLDGGFRNGRQYGRGKSGGQRRDDYRVNYDAGRSGGNIDNQISVLGRRNVHTSRTNRPRYGHSSHDHHTSRYSRTNLQVTIINKDVDPVAQALSSRR